MADAFAKPNKLKDASKKVIATNRVQDTENKPKLKKKRRKLPEQRVIDKLQSKLRAACMDTKPSKFFGKFDKDKSGDLSVKELEKLIRTSLKITKKELSEKDISALVQALDYDDSGSISIEELGDFVEFGAATFYGNEVTRDGSKTKWGESKGDSEAMKNIKRKSRAKKRKKLDEDLMEKFRTKLQAATFGQSPSELFKSFDRSGDGLLDASELTSLVRKELKIASSELTDDDIKQFVNAVDDDKSGTLGLEELADFVEHGTATFYADSETASERSRSLSPDRQRLKWGERAEESQAAKEDRKARLAKKRRPDFDEDLMRKLQGKLQAATFGADPLEIFRKFDKDGSGDLDEVELTRLIRLELKVSENDLPDDLIRAFMRAIDDDGDKVVNVGELADFVQFGMVTFYADASETASKAKELGLEGKLAWGERAADPDLSPEKLDERRGKAHLGSLSAAQKILDEDISTITEPAPVLKRPSSFVERDYADMEDEIRTLEARVSELKRRQAASRNTSHLTGVYHPPDKAISEDALYIDALLQDSELRLDDCGLEPALEAYRNSIAQEHPNDVAAATALLKIGAMLRDVAEGRAYTLKTASEVQKRAVHRAATGLAKDHALALAARRALGGTLALLDDKQGAREQFRVVLRMLEAREPACPPALVDEMRRLLDGVGGGGGE
jgi:Ca2+-binding EF-hand superfamily protein